MVEDDPSDYEKIKSIISDSYRYVRKRFDTMSPNLLVTPLKCLGWTLQLRQALQIVDPVEEEHGGFTFTDLDSIWIIVNCHENNDMVKPSHSLFE